MEVKEILVNRFISKSEIEGIDFVINSYVGCPNACKYCYASFMKNLKSHDEKWGTFLDVKMTDYKLRKRSIEGKTYLMSSTTDCYNIYEEKYELTRNILKQLINFDFKLIIETKNALILRDINLLKQMKNLEVFISISTLSEKILNDIEKESSIENRLQTIKKLHENGIKVGVSIAPFFPFLTDYKKIIEETKDYAFEYHFEFLKLKGESKREILKYIGDNYNEYYLEYANIYLLNNDEYYKKMRLEIENYCENLKISYKIF